MRQQQVRAEAYQAANTVRCGMQDRTIEVVRCHPAGGCRTQRAIVTSQRLLPLPRWAKLHAADVIHRDLREVDVAAWHIDAAGQRMQD
jgi:hypothetical protein